MTPRRDRQETPQRRHAVSQSREFPSFEQIHRHVAEFVERHPAICRMECLGRSPEGREVLGVEVTDPAVRPEDKHLAMVVCGRHGVELGTRVVGTALLAWLASPAAAETLRRQRVFLVPVANPDGCARDEFHAPRDGPSDLERRTILALAERLIPDAVVDVHSLGGSDVEAVIAAHTDRCAVDELIHHDLAAAMARAAGERGYPFDVEAVPFEASYNNFFCGPCHQRCHSVAFGIETNHLVLTPAQAAESAAAAIVALLDAANRRRGWQSEAGYPNQILLGNFSCSVRPGGADAEERRRSRAEVWRNRAAFGPLKREMPDRRAVKLTVPHAGYSPGCCWSICLRMRGEPALRGVALDGHAAERRVFRDECSTFVSVCVPPGGPESHEVVIEF